MKRTFLIFITIFLALFTVIEGFSISILAINQYLKHRPMDNFLRQFLLTRLFAHSLNDLTYVGDLTPHSGDWKKFMPADPLLGVRMGKSVIATHYARYTYITNSQGFLSTGDHDFFYEKKKPTDRYRIIVVGGSTVLGQGAYVPSENLPAQIKKMLPNNYEVINAGGGVQFISGASLFNV